VHVYKTALLLVEEGIMFNQKSLYPLYSLTCVFSPLSATVWWNCRPHYLGRSLAPLLLLSLPLFPLSFSSPSLSCQDDTLTLAAHSSLTILTCATIYELQYLFYTNTLQTIVHIFNFSPINKMMYSTPRCFVCFIETKRAVFIEDLS